MLIVVSNILAWLVIHLCISYIGFLLHRNIFWHESWLYRERRWEKKGKTYEHLGIKSWKRLAPDAGGWFRGGFHKKGLRCTDLKHLYAFYVETKRAELVHWLCIPPAFFFFLWNEPTVGWIMLLYAICFNIPLIIIQRYNRIRLRRVLRSSI